MRLLPTGTTSNGALLIVTRGLRGLGDGFVAVVLPIYLAGIGFSPFEIGLIAAATLVGSGAFTVAIGFLAHRRSSRAMLIAAAVLMAATGLGFSVTQSFWLLLAIAFIGTINPSTGDVSVFLPLEQPLLAAAVPAAGRTALYSRYRLVASFCAAFGALVAGVPSILAAFIGLSQALQAMFILYALIGVMCLVLYTRLTVDVTVERRHEGPPLGPSRGIVYKLAALFSLDAFGGAFVYQPLIVLWLYARFGLTIAMAAPFFFAAGLVAAISQLTAAPLARRFGLVNTMVFTHLPANLALAAAPFMPELPLALLCIGIRSALAGLDIPARTSYVMAVVTPAERPAAATVTAAPRSLATAAGPIGSSYLLGLSSFGWPLVIGGLLKAIYDVAFLVTFSRVKPPEETLDPPAPGAANAEVSAAL